MIYDNTKKYKNEYGHEVKIHEVIEKQDVIFGMEKTKGGRWIQCAWAIKNNSLVEVQPFEDFKIDEKVLVWDEGDSEKERRYFAGVDRAGDSLKPLVFINGSDSWSSDGNTTSWDFCERYIEE